MTYLSALECLENNKRQIWRLERIENIDINIDKRAVIKDIIAIECAPSDTDCTVRVMLVFEPESKTFYGTFLLIQSATPSACVWAFLNFLQSLRQLISLRCPTWQGPGRCRAY